MRKKKISVSRSQEREKKNLPLRTSTHPRARKKKTTSLLGGGGGPPAVACGGREQKRELQCPLPRQTGSAQKEKKVLTYGTSSCKDDQSQRFCSKGKGGKKEGCLRVHPGGRVKGGKKKDGLNNLFHQKRKIINYTFAGERTHEPRRLFVI